MEDERDAEDALRRLDRIEFGRKGRRLRVEWSKVIFACEIWNGIEVVGMIGSRYKQYYVTSYYLFFAGRWQKRWWLQKILN